MLFARIKNFRRSLRFRLMAWNTVVVLLMVIAALWAVREGLRMTLISELDQRLSEDALEVGLTVARFYPDWYQIREEINRKAIGHAHQSLFVQIFDQQGRLLASSVKAPDPAATGADVNRARDSYTWGNFRIVRQPLDQPGRPPLSVSVGSSLAYVQADLAQLARLIVVVGAVLLPLVPFGGYWLAGRATQPLARIIHTAARLRPHNLEERLPLHATGDELDQLSRTINSLLDRIADYLERNREFIGNAAHELRSPLAAIQSSVEVALNADRSVEEYQELLYETVAQCRNLAGLVNQLLLLAESDVQRPSLEREVVRLDRIVEKSLDMFRAAAEERGITLQSSYLAPTEVWGHADRLWQVVNNLLDNGIKFTDPGGEVSVHLRSEASQYVAVLRVSDTGQGIPPCDLPRIFDRFYQGDKSRQRENQARGSGLGLSICQAIVAAHGGTITVRSKPGHGTSFTVILPATSGQPNPPLDAQTLAALH